MSTTKGNTDHDGQDKAGVIAPPPLLYLVPLVVGLVIHLLVPIRVLPLGWVQLAVGLPLMGAALALVLSAIWVMKRAGTSFSPDTPTTALVKRGPYRLSCNPSYVALTILYVGLALAVNALWILVLVPIALAAISLGVINREERYLERKFGQEYLPHRAKVRRWV